MYLLVTVIPYRMTVIKIAYCCVIPLVCLFMSLQHHRYIFPMQLSNRFIILYPESSSI